MTSSVPRDTVGGCGGGAAPAPPHSNPPKISLEAVEHVARLARLEPMINVLREDAPRPSFPQADMLANAPDRSGDFFRVPKIIEE